MGNKKKFKIISIITILFVISTLISLKGLIVSADPNGEDLSDKPSFEIIDLKATPNPAVVGEDITVSGIVRPQPFQIEIPKKEIILVLDISASMNEEIEILCTNERVTYCTRHESDDPNHNGWGGSRHNWISDYCVEHKKVGEHNITTNNRKIDELKVAAKSFIDKMKDVPDLKIGIVAYSSIATVNPNSKNGIKRVQSLDSNSSHEVTDYNSLGIELLSSNDSRLTGIIDNLEALGGTNTGEGMRKAIHMLEKGDKSANKTIVLMTDGLPTFYSVEGNNKKQYMTIDNTNPKIAGVGTGKDTNAVNYSLAMGQIIKSKGYNAFSIGYGLDTSGNDTLLSIHESMTGLSIKDNPNLYESSGFFPTSGNAIQSVFQKIATTIIDSYPINNIDMNINFTEGITLNIGGNTVNIGNVNYTKGTESDGKVIYTAGDIPFEFTIKAAKEGEYKISDKIIINYPWQDSVEKDETEKSFIINVLSSEIPNILAKLKSPKMIEGNRKDEITIEYEINPIDFTSSTLNVDSKKIDEAILITDLSKNINTGNRLSILKNSIVNKVLSNEGINPIKFGIVGYGDSVFVGDVDSDGNTSLKLTTNIDSLAQPLFDINNQTSKEKFRVLLQENRLDNVIRSTDTRNIDGALQISKQILNNYGTSDKRKAIILINTGSVVYSKDVVAQIKQEGYKIISIDLSGVTSTNLKNLHVDLGGRIEQTENDTDFLISKFTSGNLSSGDTDMEKVARRLIEGTMLGSYSAINPKIYFNLNNNFEYVNNSNSDNIKVLSYSDNKLNFEISSPIKYFYSGIMNAGKYKYIASGETISFKVKPKSGKIGTLSFAENSSTNSSNNYMVYNKFNNRESRSFLDTPIFISKDEIKNLTHGLYNGIQNNDINIQESDKLGFNIPQGSTVSFGAKFTLESNSTDFKLNIDSKFNSVNTDDINIYKVTKDSSGTTILTELSSDNKTTENIGANSFDISIKGLNITESLYSEILVVYKAKIKDTSVDETFINEIKFDNLSRSVKIFTPKTSKENPSLPDLF